MNSRGSGEAAAPTLFDAVARSALHFPSRTALALDGGAMSYREMVVRTRELARLLNALGIGAGDRVALWMTNSSDWACAFLACSALRAVSVPINTRYTASEMGYVVRHAQAAVVLADAFSRGRRFHQEAVAELHSEAVQVGIVEVDPACEPQQWRRAGRADVAALRDVEIPPDLACIQYTSGTTAHPKGVMLTNHGLLHVSAFVGRCQGVTPGTRFFSSAPFFHCSGSMHALTVCLTSGCSLFGVTAWDPELALDIIGTNACDVSHAVFFRDFFGLPAQRVRNSLASLRTAAAAGPPDYLRRIVDEFGVQGLCNIYGLTETGGNATMWYPDDPLERRLAGNGRPPWDGAIRIVEPDGGAVLAPGFEGEIQIAGPNLCAGYYRDADAWKASTVDGRWFRTGDLGELSTEGELRFTGRAKDIIRVGGENVAPGEIENLLLDLWPVAQACVMGEQDARLSEVPIAVLVLRDGARPDWPALLGALRARLADYKMPRAVYLADALPTTVTRRVRKPLVRERIARGELMRVL